MNGASAVIATPAPIPISMVLGNPDTINANRKIANPTKTIPIVKFLCSNGVLATMLLTCVSINGVNTTAEPTAINSFDVRKFENLLTDTLGIVTMKEY